MTAWPPIDFTHSGISLLLTSRTVSGVRICSPEPLWFSSWLKNSYALSAIILLRPPARQLMIGLRIRVRLLRGMRCHGFWVTYRKAARIGCQSPCSSLTCMTPSRHTTGGLLSCTYSSARYTGSLNTSTMAAA